MKIKRQKGLQKTDVFYNPISPLLSLAVKPLWGWEGEAVVRQLKNKLFVPQGCEGGNEVSLFFPHGGLR